MSSKGQGKLYAVGDLHLSNAVNRRALESLAAPPRDWLILAGDVGETEAHLRFALSALAQRFDRLVWVPGNHDLWTLPTDEQGLRGEAKYRRLVSVCQEYDALTPEDPYATWPGGEGAWVIAPTFTLYDYSFRPEHIPADGAVEWAAETDVICADEILLHPDPHESRATWCAERCAYTERRLEEAASRGPLILVGHFPLRRDLVQLTRIPRFSIWCGTRATEDWHVRFPVSVVVYGHLHVRGTCYRDGVRFEEVSLGSCPWNWNGEGGIEPYLREILPGPVEA